MTCAEVLPCVAFVNSQGHLNTQGSIKELQEETSVRMQRGRKRVETFLLVTRTKRQEEADIWCLCPVLVLPTPGQGAGHGQSDRVQGLPGPLGLKRHGSRLSVDVCRLDLSCTLSCSDSPT